MPELDFGGVGQDGYRWLRCIRWLQARSSDQGLEEENRDAVRRRIADRQAHGNTVAEGRGAHGTAASNEEGTTRTKRAQKIHFAT